MTGNGTGAGVDIAVGEVAITGGEIKSEEGAGVKAGDKTTSTTVSGGSIEGKTAGVSSSVGTVEVSGGEVKSEEGVGIAVSGSADTTVSGGTVEGATGGITSSSTKDVKVSGGEIKAPEGQDAVSGNITVPKESTASFSDDSALEHTEVQSFNVTVGAPGEGVRIASIVRGETAFAEKDLKAGKFLVQEGQKFVVTYAAAKGYAIVDKTAQLVWTLDQTTSASVAPKAVRQTVDWTTYAPTKAPQSVVVTFAKDALSRGFTWQTDTSVTESKVWLLEGAFGSESAAKFESEGVLAEGTCTTVDLPALNCHAVKVYGLVAGKTYSYRLGGSGEYVYGTFAVKDVSDAVTILNLNDAQTKSFAKLCNWENTAWRAVATVGGADKLDFVLYGGDFYDENSPDMNPQLKKENRYLQWGVMADTALPYCGNAPWIFTAGTHDYTVAPNMLAVDWGYTDQRGSVPLNCQSVDYGPVHVAQIASIGAWGAEMSRMVGWLDADLKAARRAGKTKWSIVMLHWGPYTTGDHGGDANTPDLIRLLTPVCSENHVDLVLQAHDHTFSKSLPYRWDAAGYTESLDDDTVVNLHPETREIDGEVYDYSPNGTYYLSCGAAGHRVNESPNYANLDYVGADAKPYTNRVCKLLCGKVNVDSDYLKKGDNASHDYDAQTFGVIRIDGETLAYDWYVVAPDCATAPVLLDTLRVAKPSRANFQITPYVQHPATNAMSVLWFTDQPGEATIKWWPAAGDPASAQTIDTVGTWAQALTNNLSQAGSNADVGTGDKFKHNARLTGLATGTRYTYAVELDSGVAYTNTFRTSPAEDSSIRFIYYNDPETLPAYRDKKTTDWIDPKTGAGRTYYATKNQGYASNIVEMVKREPDLYVIAGDLAYQGGRQENWDSFWQHNAGGNGLGWNDPAGSTPILAAIGNHDLQDAVPKPAGMNENCENVLAGETALDRYLTYFEVEPNGVDFSHIDGRDRSQMFHRVDYGPVSLIFIDSNNGDDDDPQKDTNIYLYRDPTKPFPSKWGLGSGRSPDFNPGSEQYNWLTNNLADARRKSKFTFVVCHHCPYSVGYHCRTNVTESGEWLSSRALRCLDDVMLKYGVDGWLCGHDEMMEHSRLTGTEVLDDGTTREHSVEIYDMGTAGDGLRGGQITKEPNPKEVWRAHEDAPEVWKDGVLVDGGKHYGHMEINVAETEPGVWTAKLEPVYIFVNQDANGNAATFERRVYDDVKVLTNDLRVAPPVPWAGSGTEADPYQIGTADDLAALKTWVADGKETAGVCFLQTANIDFTGVSFDGIGSEANPFMGVYDGGSKTISNIVFPTAGTYKALFVRTRGVTIRNLNVSNVWFAAGLSGEYGCAALVGKELAGGVFENCAVSGTIGLEDRPLTHNGAGLVVSAAGTSVFRDCSFDGDVYVKGPDNDHVKSGAMTAICSTGSGATTTTFVGCTARGTLHNWTVYTEDKPEDLATAGAFSGFSNSGAKFVENCDVSELAFDVTEPGAVTSVAVGSFFGHYSSADFSVTNTLAPANMLPIGYEGANKSDLRYATLTAEGDALFDAGTLPFAAGKTYRLMAKGLAPAYQFTAPGTIAFDEALVPAANFDGITGVSPLLVTSAKSGTVTTFTAVLPYTMTVTAPGAHVVIASITIGGVAVINPQPGAYAVPPGQSLVVTYAPMEGYEFAYDVKELAVQTLSADGAASKTLGARKISEEFVIGNDPEKVKAAEAKIAEDVAAFADPQIAANVKTTEDYLKLRTWAAYVGGEAAVAAAPNAFQSYELRDVVATPKLFSSAPVFEIANAEKDGVSGLVFGIRLKDGDDPVAIADAVTALANAIEVSTDLSDWGKISKDAITVEDGIALVVLPQTEEKGFMRVRLAHSTYYPIETTKTWCSVGTSITWYDGYTGWQHTDRFNDGFQTRVRRSIHFKAHINAGNSGECIAGSLNEANGIRIAKADIYTIEHGINDWGHGIAVGTIDDYRKNTKNGTFAATYRQLVDKIRGLNANAKIVVCTPRRGIGFYQGAAKGYYLPMSSDLPSLTGNKTYLKDYADVIKEIAAYEGFPVADFYANCGTDEELPSLSIDYALHPNDAGHERLAQELIPALLKVLGE